MNEVRKKFIKDLNSGVAARGYQEEGFSEGIFF